MKKQFIGGALTASLLVLLAFQSGDAVGDAIVRLNQEVADLGLRVSRLEHAAGAPAQQAGGPQEAGDSSSSSSGYAPAPARSMIVDGIVQADNNDNNGQEINSLQQQISSLGQTLTQQKLTQAQDDSQAVQNQTGGSGWINTSNQTGIAAQVESQREVVDMYATQLSLKKQQLDRLQAANSQPKQIIHGHEGHTLIILDTKFDLSEALQAINGGDTVTWTGTRVSIDNGSETWRIDTIAKAD